MCLDCLLPMSLRVRQRLTAGARLFGSEMPMCKSLDCIVQVVGLHLLSGDFLCNRTRARLAFSRLE